MNIYCSPEAEGMMELNRLSFRRGNEVHLKLLEQYPSEFDGNINTFSLNNTLYSVLGFSGGKERKTRLLC